MNKRRLKALQRMVAKIPQGKFDMTIIYSAETNCGCVLGHAEQGPLSLVPQDIYFDKYFGLSRTQEYHIAFDGLDQESRHSRARAIKRIQDVIDGKIP